eukprot:CAMPEP_0114282556 /NCGR_PEP_ID=MMETSP0059-20121206/3623_2 /TAXON_ID=36894 /ORGANISM="Pyramimonas parkeae, Strain CCMP726" /LENGTH=549 /DNA_ID=CAMNT_0001403209 /DNA_START=174 /DNA_END=1823 /DNA_ORIENTATION=-
MVQSQKQKRPGLRTWELNLLRTLTEHEARDLLPDPDMECAICMERLLQGKTQTCASSEGHLCHVASTLAVLPCSDSHVFHTLCARTWLRRCKDCPLCRADVRTTIKQKVNKFKRKEERNRQRILVSMAKKHAEVPAPQGSDAARRARASAAPSPPASARSPRFVASATQHTFDAESGLSAEVRQHLLQFSARRAGPGSPTDDDYDAADRRRRAREWPPMLLRAAHESFLGGGGGGPLGVRAYAAAVPATRHPGHPRPRTLPAGHGWGVVSGAAATGAGGAREIRLHHRQERGRRSSENHPQGGVPSPVQAVATRERSRPELAPSPPVASPEGHGRGRPPLVAQAHRRRRLSLAPDPRPEAGKRRGCRAQPESEIAHDVVSDAAANARSTAEQWGIGGLGEGRMVPRPPPMHSFSVGSSGRPAGIVPSLSLPAPGMPPELVAESSTARDLPMDRNLMDVDGQFAAQGSATSRDNTEASRRQTTELEDAMGARSRVHGSNSHRSWMRFFLDSGLRSLRGNRGHEDQDASSSGANSVHRAESGDGHTNINVR